MEFVHLTCSISGDRICASDLYWYRTGTGTERWYASQLPTASHPPSRLLVEEDWRRTYQRDAKGQEEAPREGRAGACRACVEDARGEHVARHGQGGPVREGEGRPGVGVLRAEVAY